MTAVSSRHVEIHGTESAKAIEREIHSGSSKLHNLEIHASNDRHTASRFVSFFKELKLDPVPLLSSLPPPSFLAL